MQERGKHPIKIVATKTGLSTHVIRVWEKRYRAIQPSRTETNRRLYSDADIVRLALLKQATNNGRNIGNVANLTDQELSKLLEEDQVPAMSFQQQAIASFNRDASSHSHLEACLHATEQLDSEALELALSAAMVALSQPRLIDEVIVPLMYRIGESWRDGSLRVAHEHMASALVRSLLGRLQSNPNPSARAPAIVVATPAGQLHELGALIVAITALAEGWHVIYLGPNLPAEEIAGAALQSKARVVALSLVYPSEDPMIAQEFQRLGAYLSNDVVLFVGGRASASYREIFSAVGAMQLDNMQSLRAKLESLQHLS